jgi:hypothetical protein
VVVTHRWAAILLLGFALPALELSAQSEEASAPALVMLYVDEQPGGALGPDQLLMLSRSILLGLQSGIPGLSITEGSGSRSTPASADALTQQASSSGSDFWIWVEVSSDPAVIRLHARGFDLLAQTAAFDQTMQREGPFATMGLPFESWSDLVELVQPALSSRGTRAASAPARRHEAALSIRAEPGTEVLGPQGKKAVAGSDGVALLRLTTPAEYSLRSTKPGFYPDTSRLFLTGDRELTLHQVRASRWAIDASLLQMGYPGMDGTYFIIPNWLYVKLGLTTYLVGLAFTDTQVITSNPLTNIVLQTGVYLRREDVLFRPYIGAGAFVRFVHAPGVLVGIDPLSWGGLQASLGTEIGSSPRGRFFVEFQPMLYASSIPGLFQASLSGTGHNQLIGWAFWPNGALNLLCVRFGYRWML